MPEGIRAAKVSARILRIVADLCPGIPDKRLEFVTFTDVRVTGDIKKATIFYTVYGSTPELTDQNKKAAASALSAHQTTIRSRLSRSLGIKFVPVLEFVYDELMDKSQKIEQLLTVAAQRDKMLRAMQETKKYAAGENAYKSM